MTSKEESGAPESPPTGRSISCRAASLASVVMCVPTMLAFGGVEHWTAGLCAELRMQWVIALSLIGLLSVGLRAWKTLALILLLFCIHAAWMVPHLIPAASDGGSQELRVATANVYSGNRDYKLIEAELNRANADLIVVVELTTSVDAYLRKAFGSSHPYSIVSCRDDGNFGIGIYSAVPLRDKSIKYLNSLHLPCAAATIDRGGTPVHILAVHTLPPVGRRGFNSRNEELNLIADYVIRRADQKTVVLGDLNLTPWSPVYHRFLHDARLTSAGQGHLTPTWYQFSAFPFGLILDHVLVGHGISTSDYRVSENAGSDHRFVSTTLEWD